MCPSDRQADIQKFLKGLLKMFKSGICADVVVRLGNREMRLHSPLLVAQSPAFEVMFSDRFIESTNRNMTIEDFDFQTAEHFFKFFYTGGTSVTLFSECAELLKMANKYQVTVLEDIVRERIIGQLSTENCLHVLMLGTTLNYTALRDAALKVAASMKLLDIKQDQRYGQLDKADLTFLLEAVATEREEDEHAKINS
eukprot:Selendium_serpulae@DN11789_c0_g1_i1.p1